MVKACFKQLKAFLASGVWNLDSFIPSLLFDLANYPLFEFQLLDLIDFFRDVFNLLILLLLLVPLLTILLSSALEADIIDDPIFFNIEVSGATILLKPWMRHR